MKLPLSLAVASLASVATAATISKRPLVSPTAAAERVWQPTARQEMFDVSPDGKLVLYVNWDTGNLMVHDLATGADRDITRKGTYQQSPDEADGGVFSRDGRLVAYEWWEGRTRQDVLRVSNIDGTGIKDFYRSPGVSVWPIAFTSTGGLLAVLDSAKTRFLVIIPGNGGKPALLKQLSPINRHLAAVLSPDEKFVAYTEPVEDFKRDIVVANVSDGKEITRIRNPADDVPIRWTKDGSLVFTSDRNGSPGLWIQSMSGGKTTGSPRLLRGDLWRLGNVFLTAKGQFFYGVQAGDREVFTAPFDAMSDKSPGPPIGVTGKPGEQYSSATFSPDGKYVAFMKREREGLQYNKLVIRSLSSDETREFLPRVFAPSRPVWIPGAQAILLQANNQNGQPSLFRFDLRTNEAKSVVSNTSSPVAFAPDGKTMYYSPHVAGDSSPRRIVAHEMASGHERVIYTAPPNVYIPVHAISADGKTVIAMSSGFAHGRVVGGGPYGIRAISIATGTARSLTAGIPYDSTKQQARAMGFTRDQREFVVMTGTDGDKTLSLWRVPLAGGPAVAIGHAPTGIELTGSGSTSPWLNADATRLVYIAGTTRLELWMADEDALRTTPPARR